MKVEKKESSPCVLALTVTAEAAEIKEEYQKVLTAFIRNAIVPGFRKGKIPLTILKQKFEAEISQESQQACFRKLYPEALKEAAVEPLALQDVTDVSFSPETGFAFTALVEVPPKFDLPKYKKLALKAGDVSVSDEQVAAELENYRRAFAKYEDAKEGAVVCEGDFVCFDYSGATDDDPPQPLSEIVPDQKAVCAGTDFWTQVEEGRFLPEILEALKGMKAGETKEGVKVSFPEDAAPEPLKGKNAVYTLTLKSFRSRTLPDDAGFVAAAKAESMDALRADFRKRMEEDAQARDRSSPSPTSTCRPRWCASRRSASLRSMRSAPSTRVCRATTSRSTKTRSWRMPRTAPSAGCASRTSSTASPRRRASRSPRTT